MEIETRSVFDRLGTRRQPYLRKQICNFWLYGKCNRNPCRFLHCDVPKTKQPYEDHRGKKFKCLADFKNVSAPPSIGGVRFEVNNEFPKQKRVLTTEKPGSGSVKVRSKNVTVPSSLGVVSSEVKNDRVNRKKASTTERSAVIVESKKARVSTSIEAASFVVNDDHVNEKKVLTTERSDVIVESKNARVATSMGAASSVVNDDQVNEKKFLTTERPAPVLQSNSVTVPSCSSAGNTEGSSDLVNQKMVLTSDKPGSTGESCKKPGQKPCEYSIAGTCVHGDKCKDLHSWFSGSGFSLLKKLERHNKAVTGIALPSGFDKLFSGSKDGSVCVWDCNSGECIRAVKLGGEIGCMISESPWVFVGVQNAVNAWNIETKTELVLNGPNGLVNAMVVGDDILFAGVEDGSILAWKSSSESSYPTVSATLKGHTLAVISLIVGAGRLYSGSKDETIRVWDLKTLECVQRLKGHSDSVTSLICWDRYLFSGSLDKTLKVWGATESGSLEVIYEIKQESGVLALCGIHDGKAKSILLCSCEDNTVGMYDLPSFAERGRIFSKTEVLTVEIGCGGLFFTGDATGQLSVWRLD